MLTYNVSFKYNDTWFQFDLISIQMKHRFLFFFFFWSTKKKTQLGNKCWNIDIYGGLDTDTTAMDMHIYSLQHDSSKHKR